MSSKLGGLTPARGNREGYSSTENILFQVKGYHIEGKQPSEKDYIEAYLLHDTQKLTANFDEDGAPTTLVKIRYGESNEKNQKRPSIIEYSRGRGNAKAMGEGSLGIASTARVDRNTGDIVCNWLERFYPSVDPDLHYPLPNVVASVRPEKGYDTQDGGKRYVQNRFVLSVENAQVFSGMADFKAKAAELIDSLAEEPGDRGVVVRIVDSETLLAGGENGTASVEFFARWDSEAGARQSGAAAVEYWLSTAAERDLGGFVDIIDAADSSLIYELIPQIRIGTGTMSLPSTKAQDVNGDLTDAQKYRIDDSMRFRTTNDSGDLTYGYTRSHVHVARMTSEDNAPWFSGGTHQTENYPVLLPQSEVITPNLPKEVVDKIQANALARKEAARASRKSSEAKGDEPENTPSVNM